jgi:hypothetical protein
MGARYFAMIVFSVGTYAVNSIVLGWVSSTFGQTKEKRAVAISIVVSTSNISFIWTPVCTLFSVIRMRLVQMLTLLLVSLAKERRPTIRHGTCFLGSVFVCDPCGCLGDEVYSHETE